MTLSTLAYLLIGIAMSLACTPTGPKRDSPTRTTSAQVLTSSPSYDFSAPLVVHELPKSLREISGLTALGGNLIAAVQDEKGNFYIIDIATGEVVERKDFGGSGDYEGIERVGNALYVLESDGDLFYIEDWRADDVDAERIKTPLSSKFDAEGLAYDAAAHRLLIACKEYPGKGLKGHRAIYAFDLNTNELQSVPVYTLRLDALRATVGADGHPLNQAMRDLAAPFKDLDDIKPAALAIHPSTQELYTVSSVRKLAIVLAPTGETRQVIPLDEELYPQPEGLAFLEDGRLVISNEGAGGRGSLVLLAYTP